METYTIKTSNHNEITIGKRIVLTDLQKTLNPHSERYTFIAETYGGYTSRKATYIPLICQYSFISPATFMCNEEEDTHNDITSVEDAIDQFFQDAGRDIGPHCRYWGFIDEFNYR